VPLGLLSEDDRLPQFRASCGTAVVAGLLATTAACAGSCTRDASATIVAIYQPSSALPA
jgi:hypothetical protein